MKLEVVRDGKYLALVKEGSMNPFVLRNAFGEYDEDRLLPLEKWIDSEIKTEPLAKALLWEVRGRTEEDAVPLINHAFKKAAEIEANTPITAGHMYDPRYWKAEGEITFPPRSPAFELVEDSQRRAHAEELKSIAYLLDQAKVPSTACGGEGDAEVRINLCERIRCLIRQRDSANQRPKGQENASISKIPDSPTTRHAVYSHGEAMAKVMPHGHPQIVEGGPTRYAPMSKTIVEGGRVYNWDNYPRDIFRTPGEWVKWFGLVLHNWNGWEGPDGQSIALPVNIMEFVRRTRKSAIAEWTTAFLHCVQFYEKT